jgi:hypothetical protein
MQPIAAPSFLCRPDRVNGMPIFREIFCLTLVTPINRFQENPPLFINPPKLALLILFHHHGGNYLRLAGYPKMESRQKH